MKNSATNWYRDDKNLLLILFGKTIIYFCACLLTTSRPQDYLLKNNRLLGGKLRKQYYRYFGAKQEWIIVVFWPWSCSHKQEKYPITVSYLPRHRSNELKPHLLEVPLKKPNVKQFDQQEMWSQNFHQNSRIQLMDRYKSVYLWVAYSHKLQDTVISRKVLR